MNCIKPLSCASIFFAKLYRSVEPGTYMERCFSPLFYLVQYSMYGRKRR